MLVSCHARAVGVEAFILCCWCCCWLWWLHRNWFQTWLWNKSGLSVCLSLVFLLFSNDKSHHITSLQSITALHLSFTYPFPFSSLPFVVQLEYKERWAELSLCMSCLLLWTHLRSNKYTSLVVLSFAIFTAFPSYHHRRRQAIIHLPITETLLEFQIRKYMYQYLSALSIIHYSPCNPPQRRKWKT